MNSPNTRATRAGSPGTPLSWASLRPSPRRTGGGRWGAGTRALHGRQQGQAIVELALASVVLLLLLLAIVDFGLLFSDRLAMSNAARGGARWASKHPTSWSDAASPDSDSIQGQIQAAGGVTPIP